ncbi:unnamed protein product, partial [Effrenium voratum]
NLPDDAKSYMWFKQFHLHGDVVRASFFGWKKGQERWCLAEPRAQGVRSARASREGNRWEVVRVGQHGEFFPNLRPDPLHREWDSDLNRSSARSRGIVESVRGEPWVVRPEPSDTAGPYKALSFGSLCEAFAAIEQDSKNENFILSQWLERRVIDHRTPEKQEPPK